MTSQHSPCMGKALTNANAAALNARDTSRATPRAVSRTEPGLDREAPSRAPAAAAALIVLLASGPAFAASGTSNVNTLFQTILDTMQDVAVVIATIAFVYAGFKMLFLRASIEAVSGPLIGGVVIGAAAWIANLLVS